MRSLDRNRVFDTTELEQLRKDTYMCFQMKNYIFQNVPLYLVWSRKKYWIVHNY